jgi:hypothetical protein
MGSYLFLSFSSINIGITELVITATSNGKVAKSKFKVEVRIPTGLEPEIGNTDVRIYPNPAREKVNINFSQQPNSGTWITLYSSNGKLISRKLAVEHEESFRLKNLVPGLYLIKIDQSVSRTYKLVID